MDTGVEGGVLIDMGTGGEMSPDVAEDGLVLDMSADRWMSGVLVGSLTGGGDKRACEGHETDMRRGWVQGCGGSGQRKRRT